MDKPFFKGYVTLPVTYDPNRDIDEQVFEKIRYKGDWITKIKRITGKPRKYYIEIVLKGFNGEKAITEFKIMQSDTFNELGGYIYEFVKMMLTEIETNGKPIKEIIDWERSYAKVQA